MKLFHNIYKKRCIALSLGSMLYASVNCSAAATIERVSVNSNGNQANGYSYSSSISGDGRYVAFQSDASNLVSNDTNGKSDIFLHDRQTSTTTRVSVDSNGNQANGYSEYPNISSDGRYVIFSSSASNLVSDDTNGKRDIFIHDTQTSETQLVNLNIEGSETTDIYYGLISISANGRYINVLVTTRTIVNGRNTYKYDFFVYDHQTDETEIVNIVNSNGTSVHNYLGNVTISSDARYMAFASNITNLVDGDTNGIHDIFVHDRQTDEIKRVSVDSNGNQGNDYSRYPTISGDGRYVAFISDANNLVSDDINELSDIFIHDLETNKTELVNLYSGCNSDYRYFQSMSYRPFSLSYNGRYLIFDSYIYDRQTKKMSWIINDEYFDMMFSNSPTISSDGTYVVFSSYTNNLVSGDTNHYNDIFVKTVDIGNQGILQFSATKYKINEKAGLATITVTRTNGSDGAVSVKYSTNNGSASRRDYTSVSGTLNWADGDSSDKTFTIDINNDVVPEKNETISLSLNNFTGTAFICPQNTAELTILDASNQDDDTIPINDIPTDSNTSVTYTPIKDNSEKAGDIRFNKFMMELYQPLTDKPTGKYAILSAPEGSNFTLEILPGFKDVRFTSATLEALSNMKQVQIVSILPDRVASHYDFKYPICSAAKIGANNNSIPAFSRLQETLCIPNIKVPNMLSLPNGSDIPVQHDCQQIKLDIASTQNGILKIKQIKTIPTNHCK